MVVYEGIWSSKHKNICNFFNSCHTSLKLRLYKVSFFRFFNFFDSFFLIPSDMNTTLDNHILTTVCDTQKLCSYLHVFSSVMRSYQFSMNNAINRYMHIRRHNPHVTTNIFTPTLLIRSYS